MTAWVKGFWVGALLVGLLVAIAGPARFEGYFRATTSEQLILDIRGDESPLGRATNLPVGTLGEAAFVKRSYVLFHTYAFTLRLRPDLVEGSGIGIAGLTVTAQLPGTPTATNATEILGQTARWATIPPSGLELRTRAIQWGPVAIALGAIVATVMFSKDLVRTRQNHR